LSAGAVNAEFHHLKNICAGLTAGVFLFWFTRRALNEPPSMPPDLGRNRQAVSVEALSIHANSLGSRESAAVDPAAQG
jgi:hypothetical protein